MDRVELHQQLHGTSSSEETGSSHILSRTLSTSPSVMTAGQESSYSARIYHSTKLHRRRKQSLAISLLDLAMALGLLIYHTDRIITFFQEPEAHRDDYNYKSVIVYGLWLITFLIIALHILMASNLLISSYSVKCTANSETSRTKKKVDCWLVGSQLLMTIWILKLTIYTSSFQFDYKLGVFYIIVEDYSSIWFVLIFYAVLIVFRGVSMYFVRKYAHEL